MNSLRFAFEQAEQGPMFDTTLTPLNNLGNVVVTYNWLYSALNCNGDQNFVWTVTKLNDTQISLSPSVRYAGIQLYASVRPDWNYFVQVQAPNSANWITQVGADEVLGFEPQASFIAAFRGLNGNYLAVNSSATEHGDRLGYKIQSNGTQLDETSKWFMGIQGVHQPALNLPLARATQRR